MTSPDFDMRLDRSWLNPVNVLELKAAVKKRKPTVVMNGKTYDIRYHDDRERVFVRIQNNYAPCGWFGYEELEKYEFEADHDKHL